MADEMTPEQMKEELDRLRNENESLRRSDGRALSLKVSQKGALSVYGLGRFPVTLYKEQWQRLLEFTDEIQKFIEQHSNELKTK